MMTNRGNRHLASGTSLALALVLSACGANAPANVTDEGADVSSRARGVTYKTDSPRGASLRNGSAPAGAHLTYYGGRINAATQVVQVIWGTGSYESHITSTATPSMATFFQQMVGNNGGLNGFLQSEFNTVAPSGTKTNQNFTNGAFVGQYTIAPSVTSATITDAQIKSELSAQIAAGRLPAITSDAQGNATSYYAVFFPHGKTISQGTSSSCVGGGFCAYHNTVGPVGSAGEYYYGVHPDMQAGSGCDTGCGTAATPFGNYTSVASHELAEMMTDAEVGLATVVGPPLAWYDTVNGENGDICNAQQGNWTGCDGQSYVAQFEFSNAQSNCIAIPAPSCGAQTADFSISAGTASIIQGGSGSATVSTTVVGVAGTVSLALSGVPAGVTATLGTASVAAGAGTTVSISVASSVAAGNYSITVTGTEGAKSHSANVALTVTSSGGGSGITNGTFDSSLAGWTTVGTTSVVGTSHSGAGAAQVGSTAQTNGDSSLTQTFTAPVGSSQLSFWYQVHCPDTLTYDWATATLTDNTAGTAAATILAKTCTNVGAWVQNTTTVTAGHSYTLTLTSHDDNYAGDSTYTWFDDVALNTAAASDFSIAVASPKSVTQGSSVTSAVTTAITSGAAETVTFSTTGLPTGVTAAFAPTSASSGAGSTLTLTAASTTATGSYTITVTGTAATGSHSASLALTVTAAAAGGITNGGFETGSFSGWTTTGTASIQTTSHTGGYSALLGSTAPTNGDSSASQTFTAGAGSTKVSFWYKVTCPDTVTYDWATATLKDNTAGTAATTILAKTCATSSWTNVTAAVTAGRSYTLTLTSHDDNYAGDSTYTQFDDVVLQ